MSFVRKCMQTLAPRLSNNRCFSALTSISNPLIRRRVVEEYYSVIPQSTTQLEQPRIDESHKTYVEMDWDIISNEDFMMFMQQQIEGENDFVFDEVMELGEDMEFSEGIDFASRMENEAKRILAPYANRVDALLKNSGDNFTKGLFSRPGKQDFSCHPFSWIYGVIDLCGSGDTLRIATYTDGDVACWYLIKEALQKGVSVYLVVDSNTAFGKELDGFVNDLKSKYPNTFNFKTQKPSSSAFTCQHDKIYMGAGWLVTGSANMSKYAREKNSESGIVSNNKQLIEDFTEYYDNLLWKNYK